MINRIRLQASAAPLIRPAETVQVMFQAQTASPYLIAVFFRWSWPNDPVKGHRVVIVTDQRILICSTAPYRPALIRGIKQELPRSTRIGPPHGRWYRCDNLGPRLYVNRTFHQAIRVADDARPDA